MSRSFLPHLVRARLAFRSPVAHTSITRLSCCRTCCPGSTSPRSALFQVIHPRASLPAPFTPRPRAAFLPPLPRWQLLASIRVRLFQRHTSSIAPVVVPAYFQPFQSCSRHSHFAHISYPAHFTFILLLLPLPRQHLAAVRSLLRCRPCAVRLRHRHSPATQRSSRQLFLKSSVPLSVGRGASVTAVRWGICLCPRSPACRVQDASTSGRSGVSGCRAHGRDSRFVSRQLREYARIQAVAGDDALDARNCPFARPLTLFGHVVGAAPAQQHS